MTTYINEIDSRTKGYIARIKECLINSEKEVIHNTDLEKALISVDNLGYCKKIVGKVRDIYLCKDIVIMVATDRQSAFDRLLTSVPFKGQVLNLSSSWWFNQTSSFIPNHVISCPHPNIVIGKRCTVFPIEFVVRGYISGTTSTSMWKNYQKGLRDYCGHVLPDGLKKNVKLSHNMLTPTTKDESHDELISENQILSSGRMSKEDWDICSSYAHKLFSYSQELALSKGLILVDTKYEFGKDQQGNILLIDELQTPDSSRYWLAETYQSRMDADLEPENIDKEFLRRWYAENCNPYGEEMLPDAPIELVVELSRRYIMIYEVLTGTSFSFDSIDMHESIHRYFAR